MRQLDWQQQDGPDRYGVAWIVKRRIRRHACHVALLLECQKGSDETCREPGHQPNGHCEVIRERSEGFEGAAKQRVSWERAAIPRTEPVRRAGESLQVIDEQAEPAVEVC